MMNPWDAPVIQQLLADEHVALSGFPHADAVVALYPFLTKVIVPRGVTDLARDQPVCTENWIRLDARQRLGNPAT